MLGRITFNSLQDLEIGESKFMDEPSVVFPSVLLRSLGAASSIRIFHLQLCRVSLEDVVDVIKQLHALASLETPHLRAVGEQKAPKFVEDMTLRFDSNGRMISGQNPLLEILDASLPAAFCDLEDQFVDMVESRWRLPPSPATSDGRPVPRLRKLQLALRFVKNMKKKVPEAYKRLKAIKQEGMVITRFPDNYADW